MSEQIVFFACEQKSIAIKCTIYLQLKPSKQMLMLYNNNIIHIIFEKYRISYKYFLFHATKDTIRKR